MQSTRSIITCLQISRCISTSSAHLNFSRESRFMKRIMHGSHKSKKKWYDEGLNLRNVTNIDPTKKSPSPCKTHRMIVRDKLFMEHITDQISMGEACNIINGRIEITCVKITRNFNCVNVYWVHSSNSDVSFINEEALQKCARIIRHELSQLRVIGIVPPIQFVEDKRFSMAQEVEKRLATINFEENCEETLLYYEQPLIASDISTVDQTLHKELVTNHDTETDGPRIQLPMMRHDVLGLDHYKIMSRITASLSKSREAAQRRMGVNTNIDKSPCDLVPKKVPDVLTQKEEQKIFADFLVKRQIEEKRKNRMKRLQKRELLNNSVEETGSDKEDYDSDEFEDKAQ